MRREIKFKNFSWINIIEPTSKDLNFLQEKYDFHHLAMEDCRISIQQPKIDDYDDYLFMVFHLPRYLKLQRRTVALELNVFLGKNYLITMHNGDLKPLNKYFEHISKNSEVLKYSMPAYLLYEILSTSFNYCFPMLEKIGFNLDRIEDDLYIDQSRRTLEELSIIAQDIINFRRVIRPQRYFIEDLEQVKAKFISEKLEFYYEDIEDKIDRIWELLDSNKEVVDVLQRTNESLLTQRLNEVMKILTTISVIMLPLTVITGFYGMNVVGLPFANSSFATVIVFGFLVFTSVVMLFFFRKRSLI
jgi:magnesium transporter